MVGGDGCVTSDGSRTTEYHGDRNQARTPETATAWPPKQKADAGPYSWKCEIGVGKIHPTTTHLTTTATIPPASPPRSTDDNRCYLPCSGPYSDHQRVESSSGSAAESHT
ncbi:hypothetical protein DMB37_29240 [Nocardia sp. CS682]|nr:hypothetical protein DMB37_29240 [Nocardia sp. CS682]